MNCHPHSFEDLQDRILKLEKQNRRFKQLAFAALILPASLLLVLLSSVAAPAQAPTHQASAPTQKEWESATPMPPAQAPARQAGAPQPASAAERISALESKVKALSEKVANLQKSLPALLATASISGSAPVDEITMAELRDNVVVLQNDVNELRRNADSAKDDFNLRLLDLENDVGPLKKFRNTICSSFHIVDRPDACAPF